MFHQSRATRRHISPRASALTLRCDQPLAVCTSTRCAMLPMQQLQSIPYSEPTLVLSSLALPHGEGLKGAACALKLVFCGCWA